MTGIEAAFVGVVAVPPDLKTSKAGKTWCALLIRVGDGDGAQFVRVAAFQEMAEIAAKLAKGSSVYVEGRLTLNQWTDQSGADRHGLNVAASLVHPLAQIGRRKPKPSRDARPHRSAADDWQRPLDDTPRYREPCPDSLNEPIPF